MSLLKYFDLNVRTTKAYVRLSEDVKHRGFGPDDVKKSKKNVKTDLTWWEQVFMYVGVVIGIIFSKSLNVYSNSGILSLDIGIQAFLVYSVIALVTIPIIYEKLSIKANTPFIVRFGLFVQYGVFGELILNSVIRTILKH
ncbi:MAG: hypothetical protein HQK88_05170 [Nitrospirae bacterium]|nr:hypothetical protein [Nitrospirota bacterium]MBF0534036.1 hypothetical protein [Nitrospirota bacterium]MBF0616195.1 hypothetical protein [Nitrospirota bacterium]